MAKFAWDNSLSVGVAAIDNQHQMWIRRLGDIAEAIETFQGPQRVGEALGFLIDYTDFHFATEENAMDATQYPDMANHKARHAELRTTLAQLEDEFQEDGATHILADSVNTLIFNWLTNHIREVDVQFGAFLKERGYTLLQEPEAPEQA